MGCLRAEGHVDSNPRKQRANRPAVVPRSRATASWHSRYAGFRGSSPRCAHMRHVPWVSDRALPDDARCIRPPLPRSTAGRQNAAIAPTARANSDPGPTIVAAQRARTSVHEPLLCLWPWIQGAEQERARCSEVPVARCGRLGSGTRSCTEVRARRGVRVLRPRERVRHHVGPHTRRAPPLGASTTPGGLWGVPTALTPAGLACGAPTAPAEAAKAVLADMGLQHVWPQSGGMWPSRPNPRPLRAT